MKAGYCRVSTGKAEQDLSIEHQQASLLECGCEVVFVERRSAYKRHVKRKEWEKFKGFIEDGVITHAVLINLQRTTRACESEAFFELCKTVGCQVTVLDGTDIDTETPQGFLMVRMQDTVNRMESMLKSRAVLAAHKRLKKAGHTCIGHCPFGYRYDGKQPEPDPEQWPQAQKLWAHLKRNNYAASQTLREGNYKFSVPGLVRWMRNPMLRGEVYGQSDAVLPLISEQEFLAAERALKQRSFHAPNRQRVERLLTGLVHCQSCSKPLYYMKTAGKSRLKCMNNRCDWYGRGLAEFKIKAQVIEALRQNAQQMANKSQERKPAQVTPQQKQWQENLSLLLDLQKRGVPNLEPQIKDYRIKLMPQERKRHSVDWSDLALRVRDQIDFTRFSEEDLRELFLEFVDDLIYVGNPNWIEVRLRDNLS